jgi:hypothetical protein
LDRGLCATLYLIIRKALNQPPAGCADFEIIEAVHKYTAVRLTEFPGTGIAASGCRQKNTITAFDILE